LSYLIVNIPFYFSLISRNTLSVMTTERCQSGGAEEPVRYKRT